MSRGKDQKYSSTESCEKRQKKKLNNRKIVDPNFNNLGTRRSKRIKKMNEESFSGVQTRRAQKLKK